jgi:hypothetical protein
MKISESKSTSSNLYAEFAGYCVTKDMMIRPGKCRIPTRQNIVSLALEYESDLQDEVTPEVALALRNILSLPPDKGGKGLGLVEVPEDVLMSFDEIKDQEISGELAEHRLNKIYALTGLYKSEDAMMRFLTRPIFTEYQKVIDFAIDIGCPFSKKDYTVAWQLKFATLCFTAQVETPLPTNTSKKIDKFFELDQDLPPKEKVKRIRNRMASLLKTNVMVSESIPFDTLCKAMKLELEIDSFLPAFRLGRQLSLNKGVEMKAKTADAIACLVRHMSAEDRQKHLMDAKYDLQTIIAVEQWLNTTDPVKTEKA